MNNSNNTGFFTIGFGNIIAIVLSWSANHSILWAFIHDLFGWFYVLYHIIKY